MHECRKRHQEPFPNAEIHWIARKDMGSFLNMDKRINRVWGFDKKTGFKGLLQMARQLKAEKFDYIYELTATYAPTS